MVQYEPRANMGREEVLIEFPMLVDIDFGIIKTISKYYHNEDYFSESLMDVEDENIWLGLIHDNMTLNPIDCISRAEISEEDTKDTYDCFMMLEETELLIYSLSCTTKLCDFVEVAHGTEGQVNITVLCKNELQAEVIDSLFNNYRSSSNFTILVFDYTGEDNFDASPYSTLFIRHAINMYSYDNLEGKTILLYECLTNLDIQLYKNGIGLSPNKMYAGLLLEYNNIKIAPVYDYDNTYFVHDNYIYSEDTEEHWHPLIDEYLDKGTSENISVPPDLDAEAIEEYMKEEGYNEDDEFTTGEEFINPYSTFDSYEISGQDLDEMIQLALPELEDEANGIPEDSNE